MIVRPGNLRPGTHGNVSLRFCIVSNTELLVWHENAMHVWLDSHENSKQYKNAGKHFRVYGAL